MSFSRFQVAYVWMAVTLLVITPGVVDLWEAAASSAALRQSPIRATTRNSALESQPPWRPPNQLIVSSAERSMALLSPAAGYSMRRFLLPTQQRLIMKPANTVQPAEANKPSGLIDKLRVKSS